MLTYLILCLIPLLIVHILSDLPIAVSNWEYKSRELLSLNFPSDNFYPAGSAILLLPFLWLNPNFEFVIWFYFTVAAFLYFELTKNINKNLFRNIARMSLPLNPYLYWLCYSSQDTVFEFFLVLLFFYLLIRKRILLIAIVGILLCWTRPSYWIMFIFLPIISLKKSESQSTLKYLFSRFMAIPLLIFTICFNQIAYDNPSLAQEDGMTAYFSYNKYHYLSLPLFDMDVFLSEKGHMDIPDRVRHLDNPYLTMTIDSIKNNPKETILGWMQKFDSYVFDVQKVPHLPGKYYLSEDAKTIVISDERLNWSLILGNLVFEIWRTFWLVSLLISFGVMYFMRKMSLKSMQFILPWMFGLIPGMLFYTETRFKIVVEQVSVIGIAMMLQLRHKDSPKKSTSDNT